MEINEVISSDNVVTSDVRKSNNVLIEISNEVTCDIVIDNKKDIDSLAVKMPSWVRRGWANKIRDLKCFEEIYPNIIRFESTEYIAALIQDTYFEMVDVPRKRVKEYLFHFRATIPKGIIVNENVKGDRRRQALVHEAEDIVRENLNNYRTLAELIADEKERRSEFRVQEQAKGEYSESVTILSKFLLELIKAVHTIQRDVHSGSVPDPMRDIKKEVEVADPNRDILSMYGNPAIAEVLKDPVSAMKVVSTVERMISQYGRKDFDSGENKTYSTEAASMKDIITKEEVEDVRDDREYITPNDSMWSWEGQSLPFKAPEYHEVIDASQPILTKEEMMREEKIPIRPRRQPG